MSTTTPERRIVGSIGPFMGGNSDDYPGDTVAAVRAELVAYAARFGVDAQAVAVAGIDRDPVAVAFPALHVEAWSVNAPGVFYLTRLTRD